MSNVEMPSEVTRKYFEDWDDFDFKAPAFVKETIKNRIIEVESRHNDEYEYLAEELNLSIEDFKQKFQTLAEEFVRASTPFIAIHALNGDKQSPLELVLKEGRFKSIFETGQQFPQYIEGDLPEYLQRRAIGEKEGLGYPETYISENRPIYAYITNSPTGVAPGRKNQQAWGSVFLRINRDKVMDSAVIAMQIRRGYNMVVPFAKPHFTFLLDFDYHTSYTAETFLKYKYWTSIERYISFESSEFPPHGLYRAINLNQLHVKDIEEAIICQHPAFIRDVGRVADPLTFQKPCNIKDATQKIVEIFKKHEQDSGVKIPLKIYDENVWNIIEMLGKWTKHIEKNYTYGY